MDNSWDESQQAFRAAADWFVATAARVGDRWEQPGLGEWDVRALVGHTSRAMLTVEAYLRRPAERAELADPVAYFAAARAVAAGEEVTERGREAGEALGEDPAAAVAEIAGRVLPTVESCGGDELVTTVVGGMRLSGYLPTRTFELVVHTCDLAVALGEPPEPPAAAAARALSIVGALALEGGSAGHLLLAATGRTLPGRLSVL